MFRGQKRKRSTKASRKGQSKRRKGGRASALYSSSSRAIPYHPWRAYRPSISRQLASYSGDAQLVKLTSSAVWAGSAISIFNTLDLYANSIVDPYASAGAIKPAGFTQWSGLYHRYSVYATSIAVKYMHGSTATSGLPQMFGVFPQAFAAALVTDYSDALSQKNSKYAIIDVTNGTTTGSATTRKNDELAVYQTTNQVMGQSRDYYLTDANSATISANPANLWYYTCWTDTTDSTSTYNIQIQIIMTQYVRFWARKALADV